MFANNKNSYLQAYVASPSPLNPRLLNRCVDRAREVETFDQFDVEPPFFRVTSEQPDIPIDDVDVTRRPVAFGAWALPKLRRELHSKDVDIVIKSLTSLCDLLHDPERGYEALVLRIPDRLADLLIEPLAPIRERAVMALIGIASLAEGRYAIIRNINLTDHLILCLSDSQPSVRLKAAACLEMVARTWMTADVLVELGLIPILLGLVETEFEQTIVFHLQTLKNLMYDCGKFKALNEDGFKVLLKLLESDSTKIICGALDCLMLVVSTKMGQKLALEKNLLKNLNKLLHYGNSEVCTKTASVLMFATVKTKAKFAAAEFKDMPRRLVKLATNPLNSSLQMFCFKALTNICEHPVVRKDVKERYLEEIMNLQVEEYIREYKVGLLQILSWLPNKVVQ